VNQLYENQLVRKGDACFTELHFRNIKPTFMQEKARKGTRDNGRVSTVEMQIAARARNYPDEALTNLHQFIDEALLHECYGILNKQSASGVDHQTWKDYNQERKERIPQLLTAFKSGSYKAPHIRRVYIPKEDGKQRPLGLPTMEDKLLQTAVSKVLTPVYEQLFYDGSYGFRPGKSQHQALEELFKEVSFKRKRYIIDADIKNYFGSINHARLREVLDLKIKDGVIRKMIDKWLKAGILEESQVVYPTEGTPQGGTISPLLSNIFLHYVLDDWFIKQIQPLLKGESFLIRFADDFLLGFTTDEDAKRVMGVLGKRFEKYGINLHPEKTKLITLTDKDKDQGQDTFDFLGFTHYMSKSRKGKPILKRKTSRKKLRAALVRMNKWIKENRHSPFLEGLIADLNRKLRGYYQYYGVTFNSRAIVIYHARVKRMLFKWVNRRGAQEHLSWERFALRINVWSPLEKPKIYHKFF
jgi:RNA-directed DNA polymerase